MAKNRFSKTKFPRKIHDTKYKQLKGPTDDRIPSYIINYQFSIVST